MPRRIRKREVRVTRSAADVELDAIAFRLGVDPKAPIDPDPKTQRRIAKARAEWDRMTLAERAEWSETTLAERRRFDDAATLPRSASALRDAYAFSRLVEHLGAEYDRVLAREDAKDAAREAKQAEQVAARPTRPVSAPEALATGEEPAKPAKRRRERIGLAGRLRNDPTGIYDDDEEEETP